LEEIAGILSVTRERIRQIEQRALSKLQHPRRNSELIEFLDSNDDPAPPGGNARPLRQFADDAWVVCKETGQHDAGKLCSSADEVSAANGAAEARGTPVVPNGAFRAIQKGVQRGDCVADMELLGLTPRTIGMLEQSQYEVITLSDLVSLTRDDLLQIASFGEKIVTEIFDCLARYDKLDAIKRKNAKTARAGRRPPLSCLEAAL
jgi:hypothetical protein